MNGLIFDIKILLRSLLKSPNYVIPTIVMLAIGIGSATAIISAIDIVIFREPFINYNRFFISIFIFCFVSAYRVININIYKLLKGD